MGSKSGGSSMQQPLQSQPQGQPYPQQQQFQQMPNPQAMASYNHGMGQNFNPSLAPFQSAQQYSNYFPMNMQFLNAARQNGYTQPPAYNPFDMTALNAARTAHTNMPPPPAPAPTPAAPLPPPPPGQGYAYQPNQQAMNAYRNAIPPSYYPQSEPSDMPTDPHVLDAMRERHEAYGSPGLLQGAPMSPYMDPDRLKMFDNFMPRYFARGGSVDDIGMALSLADKIYNERHGRD